MAARRPTKGLSQASRNKLHVNNSAAVRGLIALVPPPAQSFAFPRGWEGWGGGVTNALDAGSQVKIPCLLASWILPGPSPRRLSGPRSPPSSEGQKAACGAAPFQLSRSQDPGQENPRGRTKARTGGAGARGSLRRAELLRCPAARKHVGSLARSWRRRLARSCAPSLGGPRLLQRARVCLSIRGKPQDPFAVEPGFPGLCPRLSWIPGSSSCCVSRAVAGGPGALGTSAGEGGAEGKEPQATGPERDAKCAAPAALFRLSETSSP